MRISTLAAVARPWNHHLSGGARELAGRTAFIGVVCCLTTLAVYVAGAPAWVFAAVAGGLAVRLWAVELGLQDVRASRAALDAEHAAELERQSQLLQKRLTALNGRQAAELARYEALVADLRSGEGESRPAVLEYRFRHFYGRPLAELERRGWTIRIEDDPAVVRAYRLDELKAEVPLNLLMPPRCAHELATLDASRRSPTVTLEPSLEMS